jgi:hypothetical protein
VIVKELAMARELGIVRGHWRQQAHGPARALRKTLWIQPFWKGPEESRVLLRTYKADK